MYNISETEIKKAFNEAVEKGDIVITGGGHRENRYLGNNDSSTAYRVSGFADGETFYTYKGISSAVYHADGDYIGYTISVNGVDMGYDFYGIFQIAYVVGDVAFTDPDKAIELYVAEMHRREQEMEDARANAKKAFEAKVAELAEKHTILYHHIVGEKKYEAKFYLKDKVVVNIKDGKEYPVLLNARGYICFYAKSERYEREYNLHVYDAKTGNEADFYAEQSARIFLRKNFYDWEIEQGKEEVNLIDGVYANSNNFPEEATDTYLKYQEIISASGCNCILDKGKTPVWKNYKGFAKIIQIDIWGNNGRSRNGFVIFNPVIKDDMLYLNVPSDIAGLVIGKKGANLKALMERWNYFYKDEMIANVKVNAVEKASNRTILNQMREVCHL